MKKFVKILAYLLLAILLIGLGLIGWHLYSKTSADRAAKAKMGEPAPTLTADGHTYRDLNKNTRLDPYEDSCLPTEARVADLLAQMTIEEKAGMMMHTFLGFSINEKGDLPDPTNPMNPLSPYVALFEKRMNFFNVFQLASPTGAAHFTNEIQRLAERSRLGIPVTFSSDPRHGVSTDAVTIMFLTNGLSQWCQPIGFGAIGDSALTAEFGRMAAKEYRAMGIHTALHPMADLATEPRWARISGTFGEDSALSSKLTAAYLLGFQGDSLGPASVSCMVKHFPGGGPQDDGWDPHFRSGKDQVYPGNNFAYHVEPFRAAIRAGATQIMPYYGLPHIEGLEEVAFGFNKQIIQDLLIDSLGFEGIVCTDWGLLTKVEVAGKVIIDSKDYGVENLPPAQKVKKALDAGVDQFGGESVPELIVELVQNGELPEIRLDRSARKLLRLKFQLGLFDNPYVDESKTAATCLDVSHGQLGYETQKRSLVLLKNVESSGKPLLPLAEGSKIYAPDFDSKVAGLYGKVSADLASADFALVKISVPFDPGKGFMEAMFHQGRIHFTTEELKPILEIMKKKPTVAVIYVERGVVMPEITEAAGAVLAQFGSSDGALLDVIFGKFNPSGKLPFELPSSAAAVEKQKEDVPFDSEKPLFPFGFGLSYR